MPDAEVPRGRRWTSGRTLPLEEARRTRWARGSCEDIGYHEPGPLGHSGRGIAHSVDGVTPLLDKVRPLDSVAGNESLDQTVSILKIFLQPSGDAADEIQTVTTDADATQGRHVVIVMVMDRHHGIRFAGPRDSRRCVCRDPRTRSVPGWQNLADSFTVFYRGDQSLSWTALGFTRTLRFHRWRLFRLVNFLSSANSCLRYRYGVAGN